jgi:hypothetical protein
MTKPAFHRLAQLHPFNLLEILGRGIIQTATYLGARIQHRIHGSNE